MTEKNILPDSVHFVCSLTVSTLFVDEQSLLALSFNKICVNHKNCAKFTLLLNVRNHLSGMWSFCFKSTIAIIQIVKHRIYGYTFPIAKFSTPPLK